MALKSFLRAAEYTMQRCEREKETRLSLLLPFESKRGMPTSRSPSCLVGCFPHQALALDFLLLILKVATALLGHKSVPWHFGKEVVVMVLVLVLTTGLSALPAGQSAVHPWCRVTSLFHED